MGEGGAGGGDTNTNLSARCDEVEDEDADEVGDVMSRVELPFDLRCVDFRLSIAKQMRSTNGMS